MRKTGRTLSTATCREEATLKRVGRVERWLGLNGPMGLSSGGRGAVSTKKGEKQTLTPRILGKGKTTPHLALKTRGH